MKTLHCKTKSQPLSHYSLLEYCILVGITLFKAVATVTTIVSKGLNTIL